MHINGILGKLNTYVDLIFFYKNKFFIRIYNLFRLFIVIISIKQLKLFLIVKINLNILIVL
jgi:hypothetical protein